MPFIEATIAKRQRDIDVRCPEGDSDEDGGMCSTSLTREHQQLLSSEVQMFYRAQNPSKRYVEVHSDWNIANKLGTNEEKGVVSLQLIPAGTTCPYVGEIIYNKPPMEGKFMYVDAEHHPVDVGYIYYLDKDVADNLSSPPMAVILTPYTPRMS